MSLFYNFYFISKGQGSSSYSFCEHSQAFTHFRVKEQKQAYAICKWLTFKLEINWFYFRFSNRKGQIRKKNVSVTKSICSHHLKFTKQSICFLNWRPGSEVLFTPVCAVGQWLSQRQSCTAGYQQLWPRHSPLTSFLSSLSTASCSPPFSFCSLDSGDRRFQMCQNPACLRLSPSWFCLQTGAHVTSWGGGGERLGELRLRTQRKVVPHSRTVKEHQEHQEHQEGPLLTGAGSTQKALGRNSVRWQSG